MFDKKEYHKKYYREHKEEILKQHKEYYETIKETSKKYRLTHKQEIKDYLKQYYIKNKVKLIKNNKQYRETHKIEKIIYFKNKKKTDENFKIICNLRTHIWKALKGNPKLETTVNLVSCSIEQLKQHLESKFKPGMSWDNYGSGWNGKGMQEWHIDHILPCASFDLTKPDEQLKCFHYTNLQPLWAEENWSKGSEVGGFSPKRAILEKNY